MARRVTEFPEFIAPHKYPWDEWLDGSVWELTPGEDFEGKPATFRSNAITQAKRRDGKVRTRTARKADGSILLYLQFYRPKTPSWE